MQLMQGIILLNIIILMINTVLQFPQEDVDVIKLQIFIVINVMLISVKNTF